MTSGLRSFLDRHERIVLVTLTRVLGSSPRNAGTQMYVAEGALWGTIGGGQLEFMVIEQARDLLASGGAAKVLDIPLGPEIGQCCGGRVEVSLSLMDEVERSNACARADRAEEKKPHVYIMGAGHVGRALANQFQHLPVKCVLIDTRAEELAQCEADVETRLSAIPEYDIQTAPAGSSFVVLTHDHGLDFLLTSAALARGDAAYVGMIGSATKRAKLANWCREMCDGQTIENLNCPIGASGSRDKRPSVIAAFVAAEIIAELTSEPAAIAPRGGTDLPNGKRLMGHQRGRAVQPFPDLGQMGGGIHNDRPELHI